MKLSILRRTGLAGQRLLPLKFFSSTSKNLPTKEYQLVRRILLLGKEKEWNKISTTLKRRKINNSALLSATKRIFLESNPAFTEFNDLSQSIDGNAIHYILNSLLWNNLSNASIANYLLRTSNHDKLIASMIGVELLLKTCNFLLLPNPDNETFDFRHHLAKVQNKFSYHFCHWLLNVDSLKIKGLVQSTIKEVNSATFIIPEATTFIAYTLNRLKQMSLVSAIDSAEKAMYEVMIMEVLVSAVESLIKNNQVQAAANIIHFADQNGKILIISLPISYSFE
jgi:hypothetical protein